MHKIYQSKGEFDFEAQIPIIVYSYVISSVINIPINFFALTNDSIINFKQNKSNINIMERAKNLEQKLKTKFILYLVISFIFFHFFGIIYQFFV